MKSSVQLIEIRVKLLFGKEIEIMKKVLSAIALFIPLAFCSCEKTSPEPEETFFDLQGENGFVGTLAGTNAFVSILLGSEEGIAYVCNGEENISEWFSGPVTDPREIHFTNSAGAKITASFINNAFKGKITFKEGTDFPFTATINSGDYGGIYRVIDEKAANAEITAAWIVRSAEDQRGAMKLNSKTLPDMPLSKKNFDDIKDGTSNTINIRGASFSIFRYKVKVSLPAPPIPIPYPNTG